MKKIICVFIIVCMCMNLCACSSSSPDKGGDVVGYVIIPHADGDEHADITGYYYTNGTIKAYCADGRTIISNRITLVIE